MKRSLLAAALLLISPAGAFCQKAIEPLPCPETGTMDDLLVRTALSHGISINLEYCFGRRSKVVPSKASGTNQKGQSFTLEQFDMTFGDDRHVWMLGIFTPTPKNSWIIDETSSADAMLVGLREQLKDFEAVADFRFNYNGMGWLPAHQMAFRKPVRSGTSNVRWNYLVIRFITDTAHNRAIVFYYESPLPTDCYPNPQGDCGSRFPDKVFNWLEVDSAND